MFSNLKGKMEGEERKIGTLHAGGGVTNVFGRTGFGNLDFVGFAEVNSHC